MPLFKAVLPNGKLKGTSLLHRVLRRGARKEVLGAATKSIYVLKSKETLIVVKFGFVREIELQVVVITIVRFSPFPRCAHTRSQ